MYTSSFIVALSAAGGLGLVMSGGGHQQQPVRRAVAALNQAATNEAQQRDATATRAFSNVQIKTADGACLFVDKLSGDFRANLTPVQIASCGTTDGQGWDVITAGKHNDQKGQILLVSTLTQACMNFDPRRKPGDQLNLFSCGGRADGGGGVTGSQLFKFDGGAGPLSLKPTNGEGKCLSSKGQRVDAAQCAANAADQTFTFSAPGGAAGKGNKGSNNNNNNNAGNGNVGSGNGSAGNGTEAVGNGDNDNDTNDNGEEGCNNARR
ncbi:Ricin B-related lectin [Moelleriella libera RCEF 2490]|uniref:Ricin B-related lectin n=1 Tax=Moelleriella libera RCEF 2490 TaxID=1081109 RepID=A0A166NLJ0_9HYPO|nr:Ricin B-related lectin [Moelleriella libera RCEF 2490]